MSELDITMAIQKFAKENDLYSREVANLLSEGGIDRLISQYKNISRRLDDVSNENRELKKRIEELENQETTDLPFDPMEVANYLINATYKRETTSIEKAFYKTPDVVEDKYSIDALEQIAEHLLIYCKHNKERDEK